MNLGNNLITLRKRDNISQEELAEKLDVSRQAVSKWESGSGYPETEKLIRLCEIFNCSMDALIKGKIETENNIDLNEYDKSMKSFGKGISLGVFLILLGVTLLILFLGKSSDINNIEEREIFISVSTLLIFVLFSVPLFIINGLKMESFKKKYTSIINTYREEEIDKFDKKFAIVITLCVITILLGVISLLLMYGFKTYDNDLIPVGVFMIFITVSVPFLTYYGIQKDKYDIKKYNRLNSKISPKEIELIGKISAVIMIITTIIYFILGFIFNLWKCSWILYPISGMICGIFAVILDKKD